MRVLPAGGGTHPKLNSYHFTWENREKRREEPFLSLRLMHGEEAHLLLALDNDERRNLLAFAKAVAEARNPER